MVFVVHVIRFKRKTERPESDAKKKKLELAEEGTVKPGKGKVNHNTPTRPGEQGPKGRKGDPKGERGGKGDSTVLSGLKKQHGGGNNLHESGPVFSKKKTKKG